MPSTPVTPQTPSTFDVDALRAQFPALAAGAAHFDGPGGSQTPRSVAEAIAGQLTQPMSTRGEVTLAERNSDAAVHAAREALGDLLGTDPGGVVVGRSMTALTFEMAGTLARSWGPGDEVVVSRLDHDANIRPWVLAAERVGATVRWAEFDPATGELSSEAVAAVLTDRTRLVAVTAASNLIGTMPDLPAIASAAHDVGALLYVDAVHLAPHGSIDRMALGADFIACSPYKFFGPHCGALAAAPELLESLHPDKLLPSSDAVPERFELGTLPYELMAGVTAAVDVIAGIAGVEDGSRRERLRRSLGAVAAYELAQRQRLEAELADLPGVTLHSRAEHRTPTLLVTFEGHDAKALSRQLAGRGVNAPAGHFYALEASRALGLGDTGGLRIGLASYTSDDDLDRLLTALSESLQV
jgi:cysteine desulfurase family protein (TIGR01976 family)